MTKTIADVATQIAEAVMDAIEKRKGIIKDDLAEAARGVLAKNQSGSNPYNPYVGMLPNMFPPVPVDCSPARSVVMLDNTVTAALWNDDNCAIWSLPNGSP